MKNLKSLYDLKNLINLVEGFEIGWVAKIKMQTKTGERAQKLLLNFWKKHYDLMMENYALRVKLKQAEDAYWQVQKMHDLWTRNQENEKNDSFMNEIKKDCIDLLKTACKRCKIGKYQEMYLYDDWDGTLHCNNCNHKVNRYEK